MQIRWTQPAARDLTQICDYIEEKGNAGSARAVALAVHETVDRLREFPEIGRAEKISGTRELILARLPYLVIYRMKANVVEVLRILHGAQRWPE